MDETGIKLTADLHTHTIASKDAYCTVREMVEGAREKGLAMLGITDHGPAATGGASYRYFANLKSLPRKIKGVEILKGIEANIIDYRGGLDLPERYLERLDLVVAGFHPQAGEVSGKSMEENTAAMIAAIMNPYVHIISHPGNPKYPIDAERVVKAAKKYGKALELNNASFTIRAGSYRLCRQIANLCQRYEVWVAINSDAHDADEIGNCREAAALAAEAGIDQHLILNTSVKNVWELISRLHQWRKERHKVSELSFG